jgi:hypothetical protein
MNDLEKAVAILVCVKHTYPAVFKAFEMDKVLQHILDHSQAKVDVLTPFVSAMTDAEKAQFAAANPMLAQASCTVITSPISAKVSKE